MEVVYSARALEDLERLFDFAAQEDPALASAAVAAIASAAEVLERHPYVGRPLQGELRELVISYARTGYVALYRVMPRRRRVEVLSVRHQVEAGYA